MWQADSLYIQRRERLKRDVDMVDEKLVRSQRLTGRGVLVHFAWVFLDFRDYTANLRSAPFKTRKKQ
jgi:hypothetical protein